MKHISLSLCLLLLPAPGFAAFTLIDNFDTYALGPLNGLGGWATNTQWTVAAAPAGGSGNVASGATQTGNGGAFKALGSAIANTNTASTLFFRVYRTGGVNLSAGLSDETNPVLFTGFEAQLNAQHNTAATDTFKVRDGANFEDLGAGTWAVNTWYNVWMVVNNSTDTWELYMNQGDFGTAGTLQLQIADPVPETPPGDVTFAFRNGAAANPLITLAFAMGGSTPALSASFIVDDIYIDNGARNLANPVPEPGSALMLMGATTLGFVSRRRDRRP